MDNFLPLLQSFDTLFPIGAYTLSNGMETYVQKDIVYNKESLAKFLAAYLKILPYNDLGIAAHAANGGDAGELDKLCTAMKSPAEVRSGSERLCARFLKAQASLSPYKNLDIYWDMIRAGDCRGHYSVAVGLYIRDLGTDIYSALNIYGYNLLSAPVNHATKLVPLRQLEGQSVLFTALQQIPAIVKKAMEVKIEELGATGAGFDIRAMQHESLYMRLYSS